MFFTMAFTSAVISNFLMQSDWLYSCFDIRYIVRKSSITEFMNISTVISPK